MSKINLFSFEEMFFVLNFHDATLTPPPPHFKTAHNRMRDGVMGICHFNTGTGVVLMSKSVLNP